MCLLFFPEDIWTLLQLVLALLMVYGYRPQDFSKLLQTIGENLETIINVNEAPVKPFQLEIQDNCALIPGDPPVYLLNLKTESGCQVFGSLPTPNSPSKTIMLVSATGSGKTTLINGMINYILGVEWEDSWRYKLIDEQPKATQGCSQTSEVTAYQIHHREEFQVPYSVTILDTPGFGGSGGAVRDKEIAEKIRDFFAVKAGFNRIDAVCFVVQAGLASLSPKQKYIFDAILSIFGKDIGNNIFTLVTFADGQSAPVLKAITAANISCATNADMSPVHFEFNSSVLFARNAGGSSDDNNDHMFWKMGKASMTRFFTHLTRIQPQSLMLTRQVIQERLLLEETVEGLQPMIRKSLSILEKMNTTKTALQNLEAQKKENEDFVYEVEYKKHEKIPISPGISTLTCQKCQFTCHYPCNLPQEGNKRQCHAMENGMCKECPGKCVWTVHTNVPYRWEITLVKEKRTLQELKSKYEADFKEQKMRLEKIICQLEVEYAQVQGKVVDMLNTVTKCLMRLSEIALRPDPLTTPDYIDLLIEAERREAKAGHTQRINELQEVKQSAIIVQKMADGANLTAKENAGQEKMKSNVKGIFSDFHNL